MGFRSAILSSLIALATCSAAAQTGGYHSQTTTPVPIVSSAGLLTPVVTAMLTEGQQVFIQADGVLRPDRAGGARIELEHCYANASTGGNYVSITGTYDYEVIQQTGITDDPVSLATVLTVTAATAGSTSLGLCGRKSIGVDTTLESGRVSAMVFDPASLPVELITFSVD